jgi:hypothetical protein
MSWMTAMARRWWPHFSKDDLVDAEIEDSSREHSKLATRVSGLVEERAEMNKKLHEALVDARMRVTAYSDLESLIRKKKERNDRAR